MRIGVAATPDVAIPTLEWLITSEHQLERVITQPDRPAGRGRELSQSPVSSWALNHGIDTIKPQSPSELVGVIDTLDVVITIGYGILLPEEILTLPRNGFLNLHFSLLPAYRGAAPVQRAIENGETVSGVTVFKLDKGMDTGPIYSRKSVDIEPDWRSCEALSHLADLGPEVIESALAAISAGVAPTAQSGTPSMAAKISKADARIDWSATGDNIVNRVRAFYPAPVAWCNWRESSLKITRAVNSHSDIFLAPGHIHCREKSVLVGTGDGTVIELLSLVPAGKKEMSAGDWARGAHISEGESFG